MYRYLAWYDVQVKAIVKKVERPLVPGTPPKVYLTTVPLLADRSATQGQPSQPAAVSHSNEDDADGAEGAAWTAKDLELMNARASDRHTAAMKHWTAKHLGQLSRQLGRVARVRLGFALCTVSVCVCVRVFAHLRQPILCILLSVCAAQALASCLSFVCVCVCVCVFSAGACTQQGWER